MNQQNRLLDISWGTIAKISLVVVFFYILYLIRDILIWFIFALIISVLFNPAIDFLERRKIPRTLSVIFVYIGVFGIISLLFYLIVPLFIQEIQLFLQSFPQYFEKISPPLRGLGLQAFENIESFINAFEKTLEGMAANIFNVLFIIFGGIFSTLFVITTAIFLSLEPKPVERALRLFFPEKYEAYVLALWRRCQRKVSGWLGVRILSCLFVGGACYIAFLLFNVKYPFTLALFAAVFNFIPYIGPLFTGVLLFLIIFPTEMLKAIFVLIVFVLIQLIEGNVLLPILTKKIIGLSPVLVLVALAAGGKLWGLLGAILAVPLAGILFEFLREFLQKRKDSKLPTTLPPPATPSEKAEVM